MHSQSKACVGQAGPLTALRTLRLFRVLWVMVFSGGVGEVTSELGGEKPS